MARETTVVVGLSPRDFDAVLFDLDGVLTRTASVHAEAWKRLFDDFLRQHAANLGEEFKPFDIEADYRQYVDGKPRQDGVVSFLESRGIVLPLDAPADTPGLPSVRSLARQKDEYFLVNLARDGVQVYEESIELVRALRAQEIRIGVVSSSRNCAEVLQAAGIEKLFDVRVDGNDIVDGGLRGKPAPDSFLAAAERLRVDPRRAVVVEDAIAGVEAGAAGHFGCVIGVDRSGQSQALRQAGADLVVGTLAQVRVALEPPSSWSLVYETFEPSSEGVRESLCALGNGYFCSRGAASWASADAVHYPGTYIAGGYNRLRTGIAGRVVENEDLVNFPNWLLIGIKIGSDGESWFSEDRVRLLDYRQELDLRRGVLMKSLQFEDTQGRRTRLRERRLISMADMHLGAVELSITAENWSGPVTLRSAIDGRVVNNGAALYRVFDNQHLEAVPRQTYDGNPCGIDRPEDPPRNEGVAIACAPPVSASPVSPSPAGGAPPHGASAEGVFREDRLAADTVVLTMVTRQSRLAVSIAARTRLISAGRLHPVARHALDTPAYVAQDLEVELEQGLEVSAEKLIALHTSRDLAISECSLAARKALARYGTFDAAMDAHVQAWRRLWRRFDIHLVPAEPGLKLNALMLLRLNILHLLQAVSPNSIGLDIGVPARGWTGEAYQGHIFWDELFIFPFFNIRMPEITRSLLMYRYRRLGEARDAAAKAGFRGAMFPWQSASDGQEETQELNLNPRSGRWVHDNSYLQRHVGSAVAYNVWQYFQVTHDLEFLHAYGAELILEIAHFWSSIAHFNPDRQRYEIRGVVGPDEFHEAYPQATEPGLNNNAYTNLMAVWVLCRALDVLDVVSEMDRLELTGRLGLTASEISRWEDISRRMYVPFHDDGIISQFEGYEQLRELDWESYRSRYGNIQRLDLILEAEEDSANNYKLSKQADVLMLFYLFSARELGALLARLDYHPREGTIPRNVAYYQVRSSHGSTLSRVVMAWVLARSDRQEAMRFFAEALQSDVSDIQQGSTAEGVHLGAMAGTVDLMQRVSTGIEVAGDELRFNPVLPPELVRLDMRIRYRGHSIDLSLTATSLTLRGRNQDAGPITVTVGDQTCTFVSGSTRVFRLDSEKRSVPG